MSENYLEKNKKRSEVRFQKEKKKKLVLKYIQENGWYVQSADELAQKGDFQAQNKNASILEKKAALLYKHPASCSCYACGNPRKYYKQKEGLTLQERVFLDKNHPENKKKLYE